MSAPTNVMTLFVCFLKHCILNVMFFFYMAGIFILILPSAATAVEAPVFTKKKRLHESLNEH